MMLNNWPPASGHRTVEGIGRPEVGSAPCGLLVNVRIIDPRTGCAGWWILSRGEARDLGTQLVAAAAGHPTPGDAVGVG